MTISKEMLTQIPTYRLQVEFPVASKIATERTRPMSIEKFLDNLAEILTQIYKPCIETLRMIKIDYCEETDK